MFVLHNDEKTGAGTKQFDTPAQCRLCVIRQAIRVQENNGLEFDTGVRLYIRPCEKFQFFSDKFDSFTV
jgi:hypothetical protein